MNWINLIALGAIATGGYVSSGINKVAEREGFMIGTLFLNNGFMNISGGWILICAMVLSVFFNPWWTFAVIIAISWILGNILMQIFKQISGLISILLIIFGIFFMIFKSI